MVQVNFGANTKDLEAGIARAKDSLASMQSSVDQSKSSFAGLTDQISGLSKDASNGIESLQSQIKGLNDSIAKGGAGPSNWLKVLLGGGAAGVAIAGAVDVLRGINREMIDLIRNATEAGLSLDKFQELRYAAVSSGVANDKFVSGLQEAAKKVNELQFGENELSKLLDANNVKWKEANGELISTDRYLQAAADLVQRARTEQDKFKIAEILGFSRDWVGLLEKGPGYLTRAGEEAHKVGAVIQKELVERAAASEKAYEDAALKWSTAYKNAVVSVTPVFEKFFNYVIQRGGELAVAIKEDFTEGLVGPIEAAQTRLQETFKLFKDNGASGADLSVPLPRARPAIGSSTTIPHDDKSDRDEVAAKVAAVQDEIRLIDQRYSAEVEKLSSSARLFQLTEAQKTAALLDALNQRHAAETTEIDKGIALEDATKRNHQRLLDEKKALDQKYASDRQKIMDQAAEAENKKWTSAADQISGAFNSQLRSLLSGQETFGQAMKGVAGDIAIKFIGDQIKVETEWLASQARVLAGQIATELGMTTATTAGVAARTSATTAGASESLIAQSAAALKSITADAAKVFADVFAYFSPVMGPFAAAPAAAASAVVLATGAMIPHAEVGGWVMSPGLAMVHANEAIVPANLAQPFAPGGGGGAAGGAGGGNSVNVTFQVTAMDASDTQRYFQSNASQIARVLSAHMNQNPSFNT